MLAILKLFIFVLLFVLLVSAVCGLGAFLFDIIRFKSDKQMSLPRRKLIETLLAEKELQKAASSDLSASGNSWDNSNDDNIEKECNENEIEH